MSEDILKRRIAFDKQERKERSEVLKEHNDKWYKIWAELEEECGRIGHEPHAESYAAMGGGTYFNGDRRYHCWNCRKSGRAEDFGLEEK